MIGSVLSLMSDVLSGGEPFGWYLARSFMVVIIWVTILHILPFFRKRRIWKLIIIIYMVITWFSFHSITSLCEVKDVLEYFQNEENKEIPISLYYFCSQLIMLFIYSLLSIIVNKGISTTLCELLDD